MTGTKGPLYKKKYHAAHQLYPKIPGWGAGGLALHTHPQDGGGMEPPLLEDDPADSTINSGNGLSVGGGNPRQTPEWRGASRGWYGSKGPRDGHHRARRHKRDTGWSGERHIPLPSLPPN